MYFSWLRDNESWKLKIPSWRMLKCVYPKPIPMPNLEVLEKGMEDKAKDFAEKGGEIYL